MDQSKTQTSTSGKKRKRTRKPVTPADKGVTTSCFDLNGEVYFTGMEEPLKFTRVTGHPSRAQWQQLLAERWNLKPPTLIISIIGSRAELSKRFKLTLKNGLWKAAESAGCCIISDGLDRGMTKIAGEAVRDYIEAYGDDHMVMIGVAASERVAFRELFKPNGSNQGKNKDPKTTVYYPEQLSDKEQEENAVSSTNSMDLPYWTERLGGETQPNLPAVKQSNKTGAMDWTKPSSVSAQLNESLVDGRRGGRRRKFRLNHNHQYLLLVDSDRGLEESRTNRYLETRILFERTIVTWAKPTTRSTTTSLSSKATEPATKPDSTEGEATRGKHYKASVDAPSALRTKTTRPSVTLPSLPDGLFDGVEARTSRIYSKAAVEPGDTDGLLARKSVGREGSVARTLPVTAGTVVDSERLDARISHASATETQTTPSEVIAKVPICGIVAGGGASVIEHIYASVTLNRCPMVIVRGTGGMADAMANVMDFMAFKNSFEENVITDEEIDMKIASIIHETRIEAQGQPQGNRARGKKFQSRSRDTGLTDKPSGPEGSRTNEATTQVAKPPLINLKAYAHQVQLLRDLTENYAHLLSIFDSEDSDLDGYMISALLSSAGMDTPRNQLNLDQLEIAIRLNRADIARTKIFLEGKRWKRGSLDDFMFTVILNDQNDFVSLLLENGFNLEEFLTVHTLERLYTEFLKKTDYKTGLFQQLWKRARIYKMEWVMLRDIGRIIKNLVGDFYQPLYLSKKFRNTVVERGAHDSSDEDEWEQEGVEYKGRRRAADVSKPTESSSATTSASSLPDEETVNPCAGRPRAQSAEPTASGAFTLSASSLKPSGNTGAVANQANSDRHKSRVTELDATHASKKRESRPGGTGSSTNGSIVTNGISAKLLNGGPATSFKRGPPDDDEVTLKGISDSASDAGSDTTLLHYPQRPHRSTSARRSSKSFDRTSGPHPPTPTETRPNGRRGIVRPITGLNLGYQPYLGFTNPVYNAETLPGRNTDGKLGRVQPIGRRRLITITQDGQTVIMAPKAQAESTRNLSIVSLNQTNGSTVRTMSNHDHSQSTRSGSAKIQAVQEREAHVRHAVFADDLQQPLFHRARSTSRFGLGKTSRMEPGFRRKSSGSARRVAHSILHPLTDPEKAQLKIREIERMARERRREKERKHRHRVAQGKFTLMERLTGKAKEQRLEELKPAKLANFSHTSTVTFERPAREIMVMCILVGKLTTADVFWSHEKEPIASALIASILFSELASKSDDVANKEEYEEAARNFEEKAEEVLEECHQEDRVRTQLLLCRKLEFYGGSSAIRLAARGRCIRFMAHPCCQELLSEVWMGELSPKYTWFQFISGILVGLTFPVILPQILRYTTVIGEDPLTSDQDINGEGADPLNDGARKSLREQVSMMRYSISANRFKTPPVKWKVQLMRIKAFYRAPVTRFIYSTIFYLLFLLIFSWTLLTRLTLTFSYFELFLVLMVVSFLSEELKQALGADSSFREYISDGWNQLDCIAITLFIIGLALKVQAYRKITEQSEEAYYRMLLNKTQSALTAGNATIVSIIDSLWSTNTWSNISAAPGNQSTDNHLGTVINHAWNWTEQQLIPELSNLVSVDTPDEIVRRAWNVDDPYILLTNQLITISRIFYALSLFAFYVRLMYIFSFSMVLGPKLIMINRMIVHDLLPFLLILLVCQLGYGFAFQSISFANGYYADYEQSKMTINSTFKFKSGLQSVYDMFMTSYFQMLGEFRVDELEGESSQCRDLNMCPQTSARRLTVVMLSAFILLTQVLMFNLLVATFTSTYNEIEGSSQYFWCYQRYEMIQEFVDRPSVAPPFMLLSYTIEFTGFLFGKLCNVILGRESDQESDDDPFCRSLQANPALDRKLTKWEHMIGSRRTRGDAEGAAGRKWTGGARGDGHAIILRSGTGAAGAAAAGKGGTGVGAGRVPGTDPSSVLQGIGPIFGPETEFIEDRFHELGNQLSRFVGMEERLSKMVQSANRLVQVVKQVSQQQKQIMNSLNPKDGRRLVGRNTRGTQKSLLHEAVMNAVLGLGSHCTEIEEKIEEKIRIEEQCVKAVLTRSNADESEPDVVFEPKPGPPTRSARGMPTNGRILERLLVSHRLWRIVPFNFETYPGIRMNVPVGKSNWKTTYNEYRTFRITEDRLAIPYPGMDDENINPPQLKFNCYDETSGVTRMTMRGRVRVFQNTDLKPDMSESARALIGYPLNPTGRSGLHGRGLLPHWGPNHAVHIALTRPHPEGLVRAGHPVIQVAVLFRNQNYCLPWYLMDHRADCEFHECTPNVVRAFITRRLYHVIQDKSEAKTALTALKSADMSLVYTGFLQDHLNADHAWIETIFLNIHENPEHLLPDQMLQVFLENDQTEQVVWIDVCRQLGMRASHDELLYRLAIQCKAYYDDTITPEEYQ